jgi:hypothetical protein
VWKKNDLGLYSQSSNCFVIWNLENQTKICFFVLKIIQDVKLPQEDKPSCLEIFQSNGALLCGTHRGSIYVIKTPLSNVPTSIFHYLAHSARVTKVCFILNFFYFDKYFCFFFDRLLLLFMKH